MFSLRLGKMGLVGARTITQQALAILRRYGSDAHVYLPGSSGVSISGLLTNNYTASNGSTGYSANDGTAGLVLDALGSVGPELVTNGTFDSNITGWTNNGAGTQNWSSGSLRRDAAGAASGSYQDFATVSGTTYLVTGSCALVSGAGASQVVAYAGGGFASQLGTTSSALSGVFQFFFTATSTSSRLYLYTDGTRVADFDSISAKPVTGIHATQATTANKPAERRGLYNLLTNSNPTWTIVKGATGTATVTTGQVDPYGGSTAQRIQLAQMSDFALVQTTVTSVTGIYSGALMVKSNTGASQTIKVWTDNVAAIGVTVTPEWGIVSGTQNVTAAAQFKILSTSTCDVTVARIGLFQGTLTAQQILAEGGIPLTTSAAASNPSAGRYWWDDDGTKNLVIGSIPFQMSDDHTVVGGLRLGPNATTRYAVNAAVGAGAQRVGALFTNASGFVSAGWTDDTTATNIASVASYSGQTVVASAVKQGNAKRLRVNGAQTGATDNTVMGTTTLTAGGAIGDWKSGGGNQWSGGIGPVIAIKGTVSDADLLTLERWVAANTPNGPSF